MNSDSWLSWYGVICCGNTLRSNDCLCAIFKNDRCWERDHCHWSVRVICNSIATFLGYFDNCSFCCCCCRCSSSSFYCVSLVTHDYRLGSGCCYCLFWGCLRCRSDCCCSRVNRRRGSLWLVLFRQDSSNDGLRCHWSYQRLSCNLGLGHRFAWISRSRDSGLRHCDCSPVRKSSGGCGSRGFLNSSRGGRLPLTSGLFNSWWWDPLALSSLIGLLGILDFLSEVSESLLHLWSPVPMIMAVVRSVLIIIIVIVVIVALIVVIVVVIGVVLTLVSWVVWVEAEGGLVLDLAGSRG